MPPLTPAERYRSDGMPQELIDHLTGHGPEPEPGELARIEAARAEGRRRLDELLAAHPIGPRPPPANDSDFKRQALAAAANHRRPDRPPNPRSREEPAAAATEARHRHGRSQYGMDRPAEPASTDPSEPADPAAPPPGIRRAPTPRGPRRLKEPTPDQELKRQALAAAAAHARNDPDKYGRLRAGVDVTAPAPPPSFSTGHPPSEEHPHEFDEDAEADKSDEVIEDGAAAETDQSGPDPPQRPPTAPPTDGDGQGDDAGEPLPIDEQLRRIRKLRARLRPPARYPPKPGADPEADADYQTARDTTRAIQDRRRAEAIEKLRRAEPDDGEPRPKIEE